MILRHICHGLKKPDRGQNVYFEGSHHTDPITIEIPDTNKLMYKWIIKKLRKNYKEIHCCIWADSVFALDEPMCEIHFENPNK